MRSAVILGCVLASSTAHAQATIDALDKLRACSTLARSERIECLNRLASDIGPQPPPGPDTAAQPSLVTEWIVSETTSPLDYSPVAVARATPIGKEQLGLQLSIHCRGGRSELVFAASPALSRRPEEYLFTYSVNGSAPVALPLVAATTGPGFAVKADPARLLGSLPPTGGIAFRLTHASGPPVEGRYALDRLKAVTQRLSAPCGWPTTAAQGRP